MFFHSTQDTLHLYSANNLQNLCLCSIYCTYDTARHTYIPTVSVLMLPLHYQSSSTQQCCKLLQLRQLLLHLLLPLTSPLPCLQLQQALPDIAQELLQLSITP